MIYIINYDHDINAIHTVSAPIERRRFIKIWGFFGGGLLKFFGFLHPKASKSGLKGQKSGGLLKFGSSGGLIKSGVLSIGADTVCRTEVCKSDFFT